MIFQNIGQRAKSLTISCIDLSGVRNGRCPPIPLQTVLHEVYAPLYLAVRRAQKPDMQALVQHQKIKKVTASESEIRQKVR